MNPGPGVSDHLPRILIVDDERRNRDLLHVMLAPEGYDLRSASSGQDALAIIAEWAVDLILLDVMMPDMDGYQVARQIKSDQATKSIPVIMVSALDDRDSRMLGLSAGAEDFLTKPVDRAELSVRVRNLLRLKAYGDYYDRYSHILEGEVVARTAELLESERLYRETFDAAPVAIVHVGLDGEWLRVNQKTCDLFGYSRSELQGGSVDELLQSEPLEGEVESIRQMAQGALDHQVLEEKRFRRRSGSFVWARVNMSVHRGTGGAAEHFIAVIEDITERRTLEAQLRQTNKMDAIGQLAAGVAHDFNNLLTVILGSAELINSDPYAASRHGEEIIEIIKSSQRASALTRQLLAFSRQQVLRTEAIDVNALITDMGGMLERLIGKHITVVTAASPGLEATFADRGQLEQVVMNLVVNARDAMPTGGRITIETKNVELENSAFHNETIVAGAYVMLAVSDTGTGMSRNTMAHLFEPFFTTKEPGKGTGLGLSTTYGIVKQSKGYVWVYSEIGIGTTFKVYLPSTEHTRRSSQPVFFPEEPAETPQETVLLVEDEVSVRRLVKRILDDAGYHVLEAASTVEAERMFADAVRPVDLLVTDIVMPECGGPELLDRLHVRDPALRVLFMSGYADHAAAHYAGIDTGQCFVQKPFTVAEFVKEVRGALTR